MPAGQPNSAFHRFTVLFLLLVVAAAVVVVVAAGPELSFTASLAQTFTGL